MEYPERNHAEGFWLTGALQIDAAADALETISGDRRRIKSLRRMTKGIPIPEGIIPQRSYFRYGASDTSFRTEIFRGLEAQIFDSNTPTDKKIAAEALWEVLTEDLVQSLENETT